MDVQEKLAKNPMTTPFVSSTVYRFQADAGRTATTYLGSLSSFISSRQGPGIGKNERGQLDTLAWESTQLEDRSYNANGLLTSIVSTRAPGTIVLFAIVLFFYLMSRSSQS